MSKVKKIFKYVVIRVTLIFVSILLIRFIYITGIKSIISFFVGALFSMVLCFYWFQYKNEKLSMFLEILLGGNNGRNDPKTK